MRTENKGQNETVHDPQDRICIRDDPDSTSSDAPVYALVLGRRYVSGSSLPPIGSAQGGVAMLTGQVFSFGAGMSSILISSYVRSL